MSDTSEPIGKDPERSAREIVAFLKTELGEYFVTVLNTFYNDLHHQAENESLTAEQKAMRIERAAGVHWAINFFIERKRLLESGHFDKQREAKKK